MAEIRQWWDVVQQMRVDPPSRALRRRVKIWLLGQQGEGGLHSGGLDLATAAVQAQAATLEGRVKPEDLLPALLAVALGADVLGAEAGASGSGAVWQPSFKMLGRRLAHAVTQQQGGIPPELEKYETALAQDRVIRPLLGDVRLWLEEAALCRWMGLGRVPGLFVLDRSGRGVVGDVCVLVQRGVLGGRGLELQARLGLEGQAGEISAESLQSLHLGTLLGILAHEALRSGREQGECRRRWNALLEELKLPSGLERLDPGPALERSELLRALAADGTRVLVSLGLGGQPRLEGASLGAAVAVAAEAAMAQADFGLHAPWDTALTGGLDGRGRLQAVGDLSSKSEALLQTRVRLLVGPKANRPALHELRAALGPASPLEIRTEAELLDVVGWRPRPMPRPRMRPRVVAAVAAVAVASALGFFLLGAHLWRGKASDRFPVAGGREAFLTGPSEDLGSRISPDMRWISFISNRSGTFQLWVKERAGGEAYQVTRGKDGMVVSQAWSPQSDALACAVRDGQKLRLQIVALKDGDLRLDWPVSLPSIQLVRWIGREIYAMADGRLSRYNVDSRTARRLLQDLKMGPIKGLDVRGDEAMVVFSALHEGQADLWTSDLDGGRVRRLTEDAHSERAPRWGGTTAETVFYASDRSGSMNLWRVSVLDGSSSPITLTNAAEHVEDVAADGSFLVFQSSEETFHLYAFDQETKRETQLTSDTLQDLWPTVATRGEAVAFQRRRSLPRKGQQGFYSEGQILLCKRSLAAFDAVEVLVEDGFAPKLSPDGEWLAYLRSVSGADARLGKAALPEVWVASVRTKDSRRIGAKFRIPSRLTFPLVLGTVGMVWSHDSKELYLVEELSTGSAIRRYQPGREVSETALVEGRGYRQIRDLALSEDGQSLAYLSEPRPGPGKSLEAVEVHVCRLSDGEDRVIFEQGFDARHVLGLRGWNAEKLYFLETLISLGDDSRTRILELNPSGPPLVKADLEGVVPETVIFDPAGQSFYFTACERQVHNLFLMSVADGRGAIQLSDNRFTEPTFSPVERFSRGVLLYTRQVSSTDQFLLDFTGR